MDQRKKGKDLEEETVFLVVQSWVQVTRPSQTQGPT